MFSHTLTTVRGTNSGFREHGISGDSAALPSGMEACAQFLDRLLGHSPGHSGPFQSGLAQSPPRHFRETYQNLSQHQREGLQELLSASALRVLWSLGDETDAALLQSDTLNFARSLDGAEDMHSQQLAAVLYESLSTLEGGVGREASEELLAIRGQGDLGRRLERATSHFVTQATDPAMVLSLGVASTVFQGSYALMMSRLAPVRGSLGLGALWRARAVAGTLALGLEGPAFVLTEAGLREAMGQEVSWQLPHLAEQTLSTYLTLGMLRGAGLVTRSLAGIPLTGPRGLRDHGLLALGEGLGIYGTFGLQEFWGLRENTGNSQRLLDALVFFAQARTAGQLSRSVLGPGHQRFLAGLEGQARRAEAEWRPPDLGQLFPGLSLGPRLALAGAGAGEATPHRSTSGPSREHILLAEALGGGEVSGAQGGGERLSPEVIEKRLELMVRPVFGWDYESSEPPTDSAAEPVKRIGILTSGGDSSGENAAIAALVEGAFRVPGLEVMGIHDGFKGLLEPQGRIRVLDEGDVQTPTAVKTAREQLYGDSQLPHNGESKRHIKYLGGNILRSSRTNPIVEGSADRVKATMDAFGIEALVVMGGNGSQRASRELAEHGVKLVFMPQSIDADVPGSVVSIGFPSAVNEGALTIPKFLNTAQSCGRYFLVEVMGQRYGLLTLGIAFSASRGGAYYHPKRIQRPVRISGVFTEIPRSLSEIPRLMKANRHAGRDHGVFLIGEGVRFAETSPPRETDAQNRVLIEAGDISRWVRMKLLEKPYQVNGTRSVSLGYTLRGASPSDGDMILAGRLAQGALELVERNSFGRMVGLDFIPGSARWTTVYPRLSEVAGTPVRLDPRYLDHIRDTVEEFSEAPSD